MQPKRLASFRTVRKIAWSRRRFQRQGWFVLGVTNHAVEDTANQILNLLSLPANAEHTQDRGREW